MAVRSYRAKAQAPLLSFAYVCFAIVLAVIFLSIANDQAFASIAGSRAIARLAFATLIALVALVLASTSGRMRLALQITMIYFTVFLLIPGFHHAMIGAFPFYHISYPDVVTGTSAKMLIVFLFFLVLGYALDMAAGGGRGAPLAAYPE